MVHCNCWRLDSKPLMVMYVSMLLNCTRWDVHLTWFPLAWHPKNLTGPSHSCFIPACAKEANLHIITLCLSLFPSACILLILFLLLNPAAVIDALLPLVFNTLLCLEAEQLPCLLNRKAPICTRAAMPSETSCTYLLKAASWHLPVPERVLSAEQRKKGKVTIANRQRILTENFSKTAGCKGQQNRKSSIRTTASSMGAVNNLLIREGES